MITQPDDRMETVGVPDAAKIKMVSERHLLDAVEKGVLSEKSNRVNWNGNFESWMPEVREEDLCYRANMARTFTTTIRIDVPLPRLAKSTARTAQQSAAEWDIVPLREENMDLLLNMQRGSIDGNVHTEYLVDDVREALRLGKPVYQKRVHTSECAYTQGLHPAPAFRSLSSYARSEGEKTALGQAIKAGEVDAARYHDAVLLVDNDKLTEWREQEDNHHSLFSDALLRA